MYELTRRWVREGAEVEVITAPYEKSDIRAKGFISHQEVEQVQLTVINSADNNRLSTLRRVWRALVFSFCSIYFALTRKYDVILASSGPITVGLPMIFAKIIRGKKTVFEVRDLWPEGGIQLGKIRSKGIIELSRWFEKQCYKYADLVVAASPGMEEGIKSVNPNVKTIVIPNASDVDLFNIPRTLPVGFYSNLEGMKIVLYTGSLGFMDECETAIMAMKEFISEPLALVIIGDGSERAHLENVAKQTGNPNIYFTGLIPKTEVVKWYSIASASLVGFKDYEVLGTCSPNKMFDSFAAGVPIVHNTKGWIRDVVNESDAGFTVRYQNIGDYREVYSALLNDEGTIDEKRKNARKLAESLYNREKLSARYLSFLSHL